MSEENKSIRTPEAILCFPNLFRPSSFEGSDKKTYNALLVFPKGTDLSELKEAVKAAAVQKFKTPPAGLRNPFRDGNEKAADWGEVFKDAVFIRISSQHSPLLVDPWKKPISDEGKLYSGCIVWAAVHPYAYDHMGNKGVTFGFDGVQFLRDGTPLGGGAAAKAEALNLFKEAEAPEAASPVDSLFD